MRRDKSLAITAIGGEPHQPRPGQKRPRCAIHAIKAKARMTVSHEPGTRALLLLRRKQSAEKDVTFDSGLSNQGSLITLAIRGP